MGFPARHDHDLLSVLRAQILSFIEVKLGEERSYLWEVPIEVQQFKVYIRTDAHRMRIAPSAALSVAECRTNRLGFQTCG